MSTASTAAEPSAPARRWPQAFVAATVGVIAYCLVYVAADYAKWPRLFHDQIERRFFIATSPGGPGPAGWPGLWLWALVAGLVGALGAFGVMRLRGGRAVSPRLQTLLGAWAMAAFLIAGAYFTWNNRP